MYIQYNIIFSVRKQIIIIHVLYRIYTFFKTIWLKNLKFSYILIHIDKNKNLSKTTTFDNAFLSNIFAHHIFEIIPFIFYTHLCKFIFFFLLLMKKLLSFFLFFFQSANMILNSAKTQTIS